METCLRKWCGNNTSFFKVSDNKSGQGCVPEKNKSVEVFNDISKDTNIVSMTTVYEENGVFHIWMEKGNISKQEIEDGAGFLKKDIHKIGGVIDAIFDNMPGGAVHGLIIRISEETAIVDRLKKENKTRVVEGVPVPLLEKCDDTDKDLVDIIKDYDIID